jgi:photosystem II stability/assembly factor-like uncharacterized protein
MSEMTRGICVMSKWLGSVLHRAPIKKFVFAVLLVWVISTSGCNAQTRHDALRVYPVEEVTFAGSGSAFVITGERDLLRTNDGGASWKKTPSEEVGGFQQITFLDEERGWVFSWEGQVWRTTDGGASWRLVSEFNYYDESFGGGVIQIVFLSDSQGWLVTPFCIWHTENGGVSWDQWWTYKQIRELLCRCQFLNPQNAWLYDQEGSIYFSEDSGRTWNKRNTHLVGLNCVDTAFVNERVGLSHSGGNFYLTYDGGSTWRQQELSRNKLLIDSFNDVDETNMWLTASDEIDGVTNTEEGENVLLRTTDGGRTWESVRMPESGAYFAEVHFSDSEKGWLLMRKHDLDTIYRTESSGSTWRVVLKISRNPNSELTK